MLTDPNEVDTLLDTLEEAANDLGPLGRQAAQAHAEAKRQHATALLAARSRGYSSREEREAFATIEASNALEAADICERIYRDKLTYIRALQTRLDLIRSAIVTERHMQV